MPRVARIVVPGVPHHITQRGNNRLDVFFVDDDRRAYLDMLGEQADRFGLTVLGYCLMGNHVHLIAVPAGEESLAKAVGRTHFLYTQYVNRLHRRSGHLWQNRFFSCALDDVHLWRALSYVERNPVRARLTRSAWTYPWSSAAAHVGRDKPVGLLEMSPWRAVWTPAKWRAEIAEPEAADWLTQFRLNTHRGRPLGSDSFVSKLEHLLNRRLRPLPIGRPRKKAKVKPAAGRDRSRRKRAK
jgi:putative transposase